MNHPPSLRRHNFRRRFAQRAKPLLWHACYHGTTITIRIMKAARTVFASALLLFLAPAWARDQKPPRLQPRDNEAVVLFLLDNSASLRPLDPDMHRREAIEKIFSFLRGQPYRLILFGGRREIHIDAPQHYRNKGQWTDFFFAVQAVRGVVAEYPEGTAFKMVLITDGKIDPSPRDWRDKAVAEDVDLSEEAGNRTVRFLEQLGLPLYVILIGEEVDYELIQRMVVGANGSLAASDYAQGIADFFEDDGMLLRRFIFRLEEDEGLEELEPIVTRIATPPAPIELGIAGSLVAVVALLIGVGVRSFPGSGDREIIEFRKEESLQIGVDRLRGVSSDVPAWSWKGLSLVEASIDAVVMMTVLEESTELPPDGLDLEGLDETARTLIELPLAELQERIRHLSKQGTKDEQIYGLNLEYVARDMEEAFVERLLTSSPSKRGKFEPLDFLRAKVHLLYNEKLNEKLTGPCVRCKIYGGGAPPFDLRHGGKIKLGPYEFRADQLSKGGRKDYTLGLTYEQVPSSLKRLIPGKVQRALRLRRSHERFVR